MDKKYLDPTPGYSDPSDSGYKSLHATPEWANPDAERKSLDAEAQWSAPEQVGGGIYGVTFPGFPAVTKGVRTDDAADFGDVHPAIANGTGDSPFDKISPWCDMVPEEREGGTMVPIKKFWYKLTQNGACVDIQIATKETEGFSVSPAHMDRNDGKGERDVVYVGRYHCAEWTYKSTSGALPANNTTKAAMFDACKRVGDGYYMMDFATRFTLLLLYLVECAEWNSQKLIGFGCGNNSSPEIMGYTDNMQYCTGTTQAVTTTQAIGTQWRNIEGLWDNVVDFMSGCYNDGTGFNIVTDVSKLGDFAGGKSVGIPAEGWCGELKVSDAGGFPMFYNSSISGGSDSAGTCDYWYFTASSLVVCVGGNYNHSTGFGMFFVSHATVAYAYTSFGCRLIELP